MSENAARLGDTPVTAAEVVAAVTAIAEAVKAEPEIVAAVERVFTAQRMGAELTPALKHLEVLAYEKLVRI